MRVIHYSLGTHLTLRTENNGLTLAAALKAILLYLHQNHIERLAERFGFSQHTLLDASTLIVNGTFISTYN